MLTRFGVSLKTWKEETVGSRPQSKKRFYSRPFMVSLRFLGSDCFSLKLIDVIKRVLKGVFKAIDSPGCLL
jgi:hypothetical protein